MLRRRNPDRDAGRLLTEIYRAHAAGAYRYAYHLTRRHEDADDIVQAVFLGLHQALLRGDTIMSPGAFIATAVKRRAINLAARRRDETDARSIERTAAPTNAADATAELARIQVLLYTLPETQHQAFVLRHWSGLSNREIAGVLDTTEPAVESLLVRARSALMAAAGPEQSCAEVCARLAEDRPTPPTDAAHISGCRGCRTAQQRLARAAGIAAAAALLPNIHVAHALAATVPGFNAGAAVGVSGGSIAAAAGSKAGAAGLLVKTGAAVVAVTAVTAVGIHTHAWGRAPAPPARAGITHAPSTAPPTSSPGAGPASTFAGAPARTDAGGGGTQTSHPVGRKSPAVKDGRDGSGTGADGGTSSGDSNTGSGDSNTGTGDSNTGGGDTGTTAGSDGSGQGTGSNSGGDSSSTRSGDGGGSGGSSGGSGSDGSGSSQD